MKYSNVNCSLHKQSINLWGWLSQTLTSQSQHHRLIKESWLCFSVSLTSLFQWDLWLVNWIPAACLLLALTYEDDHDHGLLVSHLDSLNSPSLDSWSLLNPSSPPNISILQVNLALAKLLFLYSVFIKGTKTILLFFIFVISNFISLF